VRTFGDWNDPPPGFVEVDFRCRACRHLGGWQLCADEVLTDIATGWTGSVPVVGELVIEALAAARNLFPFPLRGVDFDPLPPISAARVHRNPQGRVHAVAADQHGHADGGSGGGG
jgi:hypothetical protein